MTDLTYRPIPELVAQHARERPADPALRDEGVTLTWGELGARVDRIAAALQRDGCQPGDTVAICGLNSVAYAAVYLGALRAGAAVAPLASSGTPESFATMLADAAPARLFVDASAVPVLGEAASSDRLVALEHGAPGVPFMRWLGDAPHRPRPVVLPPEAPFNVIYSSGTTGTPKGIVQPHGMRWAHVSRGAAYGYGPGTRTLLATPLYSNTTLVVFFPTLAFGGCVELMRKFDAAAYLERAAAHRITHTMLVPVQYRRIMALPDFDRHDLSSFQVKFCTSAPFHADLKADVLARWPGGLVEFYGMTEGGGTCILAAHEHPGKLHTVGQPAQGHDIRLIDEAGVEVAPGEVGEVVGHSAGMMTGYRHQPGKTREAEWFDASGKRFIRTGDVGRFDEDGFLVLLDRRKDLVISGGFNIYPSDLEAVLRTHPDVADAAVVGVPSQAWGETPIGFVVPREGAATSEPALLDWLNTRVGKTQRLARLQFLPELPRSAIGKVLKRELRDAHVASGAEPR